FRCGHSTFGRLREAVSRRSSCRYETATPEEGAAQRGGSPSNCSKMQRNLMCGISRNRRCYWRRGAVGGACSTLLTPAPILREYTVHRQWQGKIPHHYEQKRCIQDGGI